MDHRQLDDVRRGALDGGVAGHPLAAGPHLEVGACQLRQRPPAAEQGGNVTVFPGVGDAVLHVAVHLGEGVQVGFQEGLRLLDRNAQVAAEREGPLAVHDAEVDRLGRGAQLVGDGLLGDAVDLGGGGAVDVRPALEGVLHGLVAGDVRQNAQLDLAVIGVHQRAAAVRHKVTPQPAAQLGADGDVLQIGLGGADAPGAGLGLDKRRMDAPIRPDGLQKPLHIGGVQLLVGAVFQNVVHHRAVRAQALQCLGVGGIAALGLFAGRQTQLVKQRLAQLLGAVQVKGVAHLVIDAGQQGFQFPLQFHAEPADALSVHRKADALHVRQHAGQRQLHLIVQCCHTLFVQFLAQRFQQRGQHTGVGKLGAGKRRADAVLGGQRRDLVFAGGRVQQVGSQLAVKADGPAHAAGGQGPAVQRLCVKGPNLGTAVQQSGQKRVVQAKDSRFRLRLHRVPGTAAVLCGNLRHKIPAVKGQRQGLGLHLGQRRFRLGSGLVQAPAFGQLVHLQVGQQLGGVRRVAGGAGVGGGVGLDGRVLSDGSQHAAHLGLLPVVQQVFALLGLDGLVVDVLVNARQAAKFLHKRKRRLFADARHAGDVVGTVAHQAFDFDQLGRGHAVFFADGILVHRQRFAVGGQKHGGGFVHQLQTVPVAGGQQGGAALRLVGGGQRAQDIVGLPARLADLGKTQVGQQLFQHRHLLGQFLRHAVAGGLVAVVGVMAEGGGLLVPGDGDGVRLVGRKQVEQDVLEPVDGVGVSAVLGRQHLDAEERAVDQAVAVQDK